ncbi:MAG: DUF72 domain-containing protein [Chitinispirillaceae bacterium]
MESILIGTSGYSYNDWVGPVYPVGTPVKDYLSVYSTLFPFTELNFTYYRQPNPHTIERMTHVVGDRFCFSVKAHQSLTHTKDADLHKEAAVFKQGISPLIEASQLAVVLFQFPFSFHYTPQSRRHLERVCGAFEGLPVVIEFRNGEWMRESVYAGLKKREVGLVNVDEPDLPGLIRPGSVVTADLGYVRFHGRNSKNWWSGDNVSRYDYLYSEDELAQWIPRIRKMMERCRVVMIAFNNHSKGQAVQNARMLKALIDRNLSSVENGGGT